MMGVISGVAIVLINCLSTYMHNHKGAPCCFGRWEAFVHGTGMWIGTAIAVWSYFKMAP